MNKHPIIPDHYFSYVSSECHELFETGKYYGCITLSQSLAEAYARFIYEKWTGKLPAEKFGANIHKIKGTNVQPDVSNLLEELYGGTQRNDFHHLNKTVPKEYEKLKSIATYQIEVLNRVESQIFAFEYTDGGGIRAKYEQYWEQKNGQYQVNLRLE